MHRRSRLPQGIFERTELFENCCGWNRIAGLVFFAPRGREVGSCATVPAPGGQGHASRCACCHAPGEPCARDWSLSHPKPIPPHWPWLTKANGKECLLPKTGAGTPRDPTPCRPDRPRPGLSQSPNLTTHSQPKLAHTSCNEAKQNVVQNQNNRIITLDEGRSISGWGLPHHPPAGKTQRSTTEV